MTHRKKSTPVAGSSRLALSDRRRRAGRSKTPARATKAPSKGVAAQAAKTASAPAARPQPPGPLVHGRGHSLQIGQQVLFLSAKDMAALPWENGEVFNHVQIALRELGRGKVDHPLPVSLRPQRDSLLSAAVAFVPNVQACGVTWFASFPANQRAGLPQVSSLVMLSDPHTGFPVALMDAGWLVGQRAPAVSAVAARQLARPGSQTAVIIGGGVQGRGHVRALADVVATLRTIWVYDSDPGKAAKAVRATKSKVRRGVTVEPVGGLEHAVRRADIIVSATALREKSASAVRASWIRSGALLLPLDLDAVFEPATFEAADRVYVDSAENLKALHAQGLFTRGMPQNISGQLGDVVLGKLPGRVADAEIVICLNTGAGLVDIVLARAAYEKACRLGAGQVLSL